MCVLKVLNKTNNSEQIKQKIRQDVSPEHSQNM